MSRFFNAQYARGSVPLSRRRAKLHQVIFEADTVAGKIFDVVLIFLIILSVVVVLLDSVTSIHQSHGDLLFAVECVFTALFTIEYILCLLCVGQPGRYASAFTASSIYWPYCPPTWPFSCRAPNTCW